MQHEENKKNLKRTREREKESSKGRRITKRQTRNRNATVEKVRDSGIKDCRSVERERCHREEKVGIGRWGRERGNTGRNSGRRKRGQIPNTGYFVALSTGSLLFSTPTFATHARLSCRTVGTRGIHPFIWLCTSMVMLLHRY